MFPRDILVFDVETTGTDPHRHAICEIGGVLLDKNTLAEKCAWGSVVRPHDGALVDARAMSVHKIAQHELQRGLSPKDAARHFLQAFGSDWTICGWNVRFDMEFLRVLFRLANDNPTFRSFDFHNLDLWAVAQFLQVTGHIQTPFRSLKDILLYLDIEIGTTHRALDDARLTAEALRRLICLGAKEGSPVADAVPEAPAEPPAPAPTAITVAETAKIVTTSPASDVSRWFAQKYGTPRSDAP